MGFLVIVEAYHNLELYLIKVMIKALVEKKNILHLI